MKAQTITIKRQEMNSNILQRSVNKIKYFWSIGLASWLMVSQPINWLIVIMIPQRNVKVKPMVNVEFHRCKLIGQFQTHLTSVDSIWAGKSQFSIRRKKTDNFAFKKRDGANVRIGSVNLWEQGPWNGKFWNGYCSFVLFTKPVWDECTRIRYTKCSYRVEIFTWISHIYNSM